MDMILKNTFQSISPAYELIGDVTVGSNTTQVDFTGLNIGKDDELLLVASYMAFNDWESIIFVNGNNTETNYYRQALWTGTNGNTISAIRLQNPRPHVTGLDCVYFSKIKLTNSGYIVMQNSTTTLEQLASSIMMAQTMATSTFTASSITSLSISAIGANGIGTGSRFQLYKLVAEKVADIIVPSNTTSVDITGLNIGKAGEYYLTGDWVNGVASTNIVYLFVNGNNTTSNYYYQGVNANSSTLTAGRSAEAGLVQASASLKSFFTSNLKLTNSGYFVSQSNSNRNYGSGIILGKDYLTSTFTMSGVTSIRLHSYTTNGIGANSRFTLYKMK